MKRIMVLTGVMIMAALLTCISFSQVKAQCSPSIELLNPPSKDPLVLAVGESYTFEVEITSGEPFLLAMATTDAFYPGRGIHWHGVDQATQAQSALLHLTVTGKSSTTDLPAVSNWPEPGDNWPEGVAPITMRVGVRCKGGFAYAEAFPFAVMVLP